MPRGRVRIRNNTIVSDRDTLLRGAPVWIYKWGERTGKCIRYGWGLG